MSAYFSRLKLNVQAPLKLKDLTYKFVVTTNSNKKKIVFDGRFNEQGLTSWTQINNLNTTLIYEIYLRGELLQKVSVKAYPERKAHSVYTIKTTTEITKKVKENIKEIYLNDGEVAWYLIKKNETMADWSKRVYKKPLSASDWDVLRANNPHIKNMAPIRILTPGQVIILSNSTTAKELQKYKKEAQEAQKKLDEMKRDKNFDEQFFAQNYEFLYDAVADNRTQLTHKNIFENNDHPLVQKFDKDAKDSESAWGAIAKGGIDATLAFHEGTVTKMNKIHGELALKMAEERAKGSGLANPKNFKAFRNKYKDLYTQLDQVYAKGVFKWDQSIKTNNMRRIINQSSLARGTTYKGGMKEYVEKMTELGKMSKVIKGGGYLFLALDIYNAGDAIASAKPEEKTKTTVVETSKLAGGLAGGALGAFIVLTVASGGTSLIVLGVAAVVSAGVGWAGGEGAGLVTEYIYDRVNK